MIEAHNALMNRTIGGDSVDDINPVIAHYDEFLAYSNHTDFYGIYSAVMKEAAGCNEELKQEICVIFGVPEDKMEVVNELIVLPCVGICFVSQLNVQLYNVKVHTKKCPYLCGKKVWSPWNTNRHRQVMANCDCLLHNVPS